MLSCKEERILSNKPFEEEVTILDFEELLVFIESRLAAEGKSVGREEITLILQAQEDFLVEKGVLQELEN